MSPRPRISAADGRSALATWVAQRAMVERDALALAVRFTLQELAAAHPGHAVEVRVPPFGAVQCLAGVRHRRGTPPNVVETDAATWLELATGLLTWADALADARVSAGGDRADLAALLPLRDLTGADPRN